jgi:formamidopyrimidine-DNA glycosylase
MTFRVSSLVRYEGRSVLRRVRLLRQGEPIMPEMPEVETVRLGLLPVLEGRRFADVETRRRGLRLPFPKNLAARLTGRTVLRLWRRAKYLLVDLDGGETLVLHLGMTGRIIVERRGTARTSLGRYRHDVHETAPERSKHDHLVFMTDALATVVFHDPRRFGLVLLIESGALSNHALFKRLGVEPLSDDLDAPFLRKALTGKRTSIKSALLDQRLIAGLGNIYVSESLFRARVSPKSMASALPSVAISRLTRAIRTVLAEAVRAGRASLIDPDAAADELGMFPHRFAVYGREGERCTRKGCKGTIKRIVQGGRSTFFCPVCQK